MKRFRYLSRYLEYLLTVRTWCMSSVLLLGCWLPLVIALLSRMSLSAISATRSPDTAPGDIPSNI